MSAYVRFGEILVEELCGLEKDIRHNVINALGTRPPPTFPVSKCLIYESDCAVNQYSCSHLRISADDAATP